MVTLTANPDGDSLFLGWLGDPDCSDGEVTLDSDITCTARFYLLTDVIFTDGFESGDTSAWSNSVP